MNPSSSPSPPLLKNFTWSGRNLLALACAVALCGMLLDGVLYCDTSYRATFSGRCTLFGLFLSTFWNDLRDQFTSLFSSTPLGSLSGGATSAEWTQCVLVPLIVLYLVWWLWPRLRETPVRGHGVGYVILATGLLIYVAGYMAENYYVGVVSLELVYAGLIVLFLGWPAMRMLLFPCAFLLFMWPYGFFEDVALQLRLLMSSLSHHALQLIGVTNVLNGTAIVSPHGATPSFAIDIADPCSGIRSLFALVMISALFAFLSFNKTWPKLVIILASVPLVILGNLVRIILLVWATLHFGEGFAVGTNDHPSWFHESAGYLVYALNLGGLAGLGWVLNRFARGTRQISPG